MWYQLQSSVLSQTVALHLLRKHHVTVRLCFPGLVTKHQPDHKPGT